ncbi:MAG: DNA polymerase ligase N-terminal domain-containing protein [Microvirga sp.]
MSKPLSAYNAKRDFRQTAEPRGRRAAGAGNSFVVQKHAASRLHYDFRLELDGVLKSWAVAKGPSLVAGEKRLAVHVEDHPLDYGGFEGTIPKGQYGGGTVMLWDHGRWEPEGDAGKDYGKGRLTFRLDGEKLHGRWHLVRMRSRAGERNEQWLLIKSDDEWARAEDEPDLLDEAPLSVATGRSMDEIAAGAGSGPNLWQSNRAGAEDAAAAPGPARAKPERRPPAPARKAAKAAPRKPAKAAPRKAAKAAPRKAARKARKAPAGR